MELCLEDKRVADALIIASLGELKNISQGQIYSRAILAAAMWSRGYKATPGFIRNNRRCLFHTKTYYKRAVVYYDSSSDTTYLDIASPIYETCSSRRLNFHFTKEGNQRYLPRLLETNSLSLIYILTLLLFSS